MTARSQDAESHARALLSKYGLATLPVPVEQIARKKGITVQFLPLDDELSGMSFITNDVAVIVVNVSHHPNRQRFTIAHELGHHILHATYLQNNVHVDKAVLHRNQISSDGSDKKEIEANAFAAELLMPSVLVKKYKYVDINDDSQLTVVARKFKVSAAAFAYRLMKLG